MMKKENSIPGKFQQLYKRLQDIRLPYKISFFLIGTISTAWFLIRVIPKPSRASYPCMKAAAPFMSSFVIYLLSLSGSVLLFRRARRFLYQARYIAAGLAFVAGLVVYLVSTSVNSFDAKAADFAEPEDFISNLPYGEGLGIFPGRVVWAWDPDATDENCTNVQDDPVRGEDGYFLAKNNNQPVIDAMLDEVVMKLSGTRRVALAWDSLFTDFNRRKGIGAETYQAGQKIFVKINQGGGDWLTNESDLGFLTAGWAQQYYGMAETSPAIVISLLDQLVNEYGVAQEDIYVGDPIAHIYKHNYDQMVAVFPYVKYVDYSHSDLGRTLLTQSATPSIFWSDKGTVMGSAVSDKLYQEYENSDYVINVAALKAHARAGITLTTKNHFGTHTRDGAEHLHPGLVAPENDKPVRTEYGMYRVLTDIMGHEKLGGNTVLFIVDGLWGGTEAVEKPVKWNMPPFNGDWPNSIFASQDQVALESVCFDFLRNEFTDPSGPGEARPWMGGVDDHLHQAADSSFWPEGVVYDPEDDGIPIGSLGIHEHWNNMADKQYSRNLGYDYGIELVSTDASLVQSAVIAEEAGITLPVIDGEDTDECWAGATWYYIDQTWITWGEEIDSSDFFGRFKVSWSGGENLLYYYVEITDDAFVDGYIFPDGGYPDFDIVEIFLDEDHSGGLHVFDNNAEWGLNSENAFSYHLAVDAPAEGETESLFFACDLDGTDWGNSIIIDYAGHFPELAMKKQGNIYKYEFSLKVYDDTYDHSDPEASRVSLLQDKELGMSVAYCDNDQPDGERDNFFGSVWVPEEAYNDHWMNSDGYGTLRLVGEGTEINHAVQLADTLPDFEITETGTPLVIHNNIATLFYDPDGDTLEYTIECDEPLLDFAIDQHVLSVTANAGFSGDCMVKLVASDGEYQVWDIFYVSRDVTGIDISTDPGSAVRCYPNPFEDHLNIELGRDYSGIRTITVDVYTMSGRKVLSRNLLGLYADRPLFELDMSEQPSGAYIIRIDTDGADSSVMILKK
jgi:hypothetical protein